MIATNYRRFPSAMAVQLVLSFGPCKWHTSRPTTRIGRAIRSEAAAAAKAQPQVVQWVKKSVPAWYRDQVRRAKELAASVKKALAQLVFDAPTTTEQTVRQLLADYDDTHHGNQARFLTNPCSWWFHIRSGCLVYEENGYRDR